MAPGPTYRIRYTILRNKWCNNINRSHKSNGIAIEVDLTFLVLTQTCFDLECKGYRSEPVPLPADCCYIINDNKSNDNKLNVSDNLDRFDNISIIRDDLEVSADNGSSSSEGSHHYTLHQKCDQLCLKIRQQ